MVEEPNKTEPLSANMAPFVQIDPWLLVPKTGNDKLAELFLALSLAYNDLKSVMWITERLEARRPACELSTEWGEWCGFHNHAVRYGAAMMHELMHLLKTYKATIDSPEFIMLARRLPKRESRAWDTLRRHSLEQTAIAKAVLRIRNAGTFHYYQPKALVSGFRAYFSDGRGAFGEQACMSYGANAEESRFYYADAAAGTLMDEQATAEGVEQFGAELAKAIVAANLALFALIGAYTLHRKQHPRKSVAPDAK